MVEPESVSDRHCILLYMSVEKMHIIFNMVHSISDINSLSKFQEIWIILTRVWEGIDGQADRQINRHTEYINIF